jgi:hypothetical protein
MRPSALGATALALVACVVAQPDPLATGAVSGYVLDALGEPLPLAEIRIVERATERVVARGAADGSGMFVVSGFPSSESPKVACARSRSARSRPRDCS